jgi:hypothetical protein
MKTFGYDYVFALSIDKVNEILKDNLSGIEMSIYYVTTDADTGSTITMSGALAPWQIVGGDNTLLNINVPISDGYLALEGGALTGSYDLSGVTVEMQIQLGWVGAGDQQQASGSGNVAQLVFIPDDTKDEDNPGYVAAVKIFDPNKNLDTVANGLVKAYMANALVSNKDKLKYIFANVNPTPANLASWLNPKKWQYFYAGTANSSALCFLCMLSDAPFPQPAFDSSVLTTTNDSVLLVSQLSFFQNVVLPSVQTAFPSGSFSITNVNDQCTIKNSGSFDLGRVTANSFILTTSDDGNGLKTSAQGGGPLKFLFGLADLPGASYSWGVNTINPLQFVEPMISFQSDPNPTETQDHTINWYDWVLLVVLGITSVEGLISAIYDLVDNFADQVDQVGMGAINSSAQSSLGGSVVNLATLIDWQKDSLALTAMTAGLDGALYVRGNLTHP